MPDENEQKQTAPATIPNSIVPSEVDPNATKALQEEKKEAPLQNVVKKEATVAKWMPPSGKVRVEAIRHGTWFDPTKKLEPDGICTFSPHSDGKGSVRLTDTQLDPETREWIESGLGRKLDTRFWLGDISGDTDEKPFVVEVPVAGFELDKSNPEDYLRWLILKQQNKTHLGPLIALTEEEAKQDVAKFYMYEPNKIEDQRDKRYEAKRKAYVKFDELSPRELRKIANVLSNGKHADSSDATIRVYLQGMIDETQPRQSGFTGAQLFMSVAAEDGERLTIRDITAKAFNKRILLRIGGKVALLSEDRIIGEEEHLTKYFLSEAGSEDYSRIVEMVKGTT